MLVFSYTRHSGMRSPRPILTMILQNIRIYWKTLFVVIYPIVLLPIFLHNDIKPFRCLYVVLLMAGLWVLEALPLPITSLLPVVMFPLMGIMDSDKVSLCYMKEANMMFIGGLIIAIAIEHCHLHTRVALTVMKLVGCSPRRLNLGLCSVTMFVSMWISNTAATAMMVPIVDATLKALEEQGIGEMYETQELLEGDGRTGNVEREKKPTKQTMCYFISTAYAASIGGSGCLIGSGGNLTFKGLYETIFPDSPGVEFGKWMMLNVPLMLIIMYLVVVWMQFWFMGLFRPQSEDAKKIRIGAQGEATARKLINQQLADMGPMSYHEISVGVLFLLSIMLWLFRKPQFILGWAERLTDMKVKDSNPAIIVCMLIFILPARPDFIHMFSKDESKRPNAPAPALVNWKLIHEKLPWGLILLLGGGFAMAEAAKESGMSNMIAESLHTLTTLHRTYIMFITCAITAFLTQFASNVAIANVVLPVISQIAVVAKIHPMYLMMPVALSCSYAYTLPVSTPPNAIAAAPCSMPTWEMVKVGLGVTVISLVCLCSIFPFYGPLIWDVEHFPDWALN